MEDIQLSPETLREQAALQASTARMRTERLQLEKYAKELEAIVRRKQEVIRRQQEFLVEIEAERQAIEADYARVHNEMSPLLK
jgi:hypothetical protein